MMFAGFAGKAAITSESAKAKRDSHQLQLTWSKKKKRCLELEEEADYEVAFIKIKDAVKATYQWYMDSRASRHVTGASGHLNSVTLPTISIANRGKHVVGESGDVKLKTNYSEIKMLEVMYVSTLRINLMFVGSLVD